MLKAVLLVSSILVAVPASAQERETPKPTAPSVAPGSAEVPDTPVEAVQAQAAEKRETTSPAEAREEVAATGDHMTSIINAEFASYDKNGNGTLEKAEFAAWMDALKAKAINGGKKPGDTKWNDAAFAKADTDKSASLTRGELTGFLSG